MDFSIISSYRLETSNINELRQAIKHGLFLQRWDKKLAGKLNSIIIFKCNPIDFVGSTTCDIRELITRGIDVNAYFDDGQTAIHLAADMGD